VTKDHDADNGRASGNWLENLIAVLDALYQRFGAREGLKNQPIADVGLLLSSKELRLRDAPKGRDLNEHQKAANRQLKLEIKDLTAYVKGQLVGISLADLRSSAQAERARQQEPHRQPNPRGRKQGMER
jgi:hypothetical protein